MADEQKKIEVVYPSASIGKRIGALFIDVLFLILLALTLFSLGNIPLQNLPSTKANNAKRSAIQESSGLYIGGVSINEYVEKEDSPFISLREKKDFLSARILSFYSNVYFFPDGKVMEEYGKRRLEWKVDGLFLFKKGEDNEIKENAANPQYFYDFYRQEISENSFKYLYNSKEYAGTTVAIYLSSAILFAISFTCSYVIFFIFFPLVVFRRGRQSLAKKLFKISLVSVKAVNLKWWNYLLRAVFSFFVYVLLGFVSFLIPEIVSFSMLVLLKRRQDLADYVFNHYQIDTKDREVYWDYSDYLLHEEQRKRMSLENNKDISFK